MEVQYKQKMQSKYIKLPNRESVNGELFDTSRLLEKVLARDNMLEAMYKVIRNKGSHGVDNMKTDELLEHVINTWNTVKSKLLEGKYNPSPVRRVEIPKPDGEIRLLGIPTVQDRMIQQAIAQILNEIYEPIFSKSSYGFRPGRGAKIRIHEKSIRRFKDKIREITNKNKGISMDYRLIKLNDMIIGWVNYFKIANASRKLMELDKWIRRRLRACMWKQWKKVRTRYRNLIKFGIPKPKAYQYANTRKGYWRISNSPILNKIFNNKYFEILGLISMTKVYQVK